MLRFDLEDDRRRPAIDAFVGALEDSRPDDVEGTMSVAGAEFLVFLEVTVRDEAEVEARVLPELTRLLAEAGLADVGTAERPEEDDEPEAVDDEEEE